MSEREDRELVQQAQRGDGDAMGELFSRYWRAARAAAFGVTGEFATAEDAAAEAFRQALAGLDSLRDPDRFGSWLRTIVVRKARLGLRHRDATIGSLGASLSDQNEQPDETLLRLELGALARQATRELPGPLREAMMLVYFEGYGLDLAARFLDVPAGTLRRRLHDGRARLRATVEQILEGNKQMNEEREHQVQRFKTMADNGELYEALRGSLALRPPSSDLVDMLVRSQVAPANDSQSGGARKELTGLVREIVPRLLRPSDGASDLTHPVGAVSAAIRKALPDFQDWKFDADEAAVRFLIVTGEHRNRLPAVLPPGFAQGRPGAFLRATRAIVHLSGSGRSQSLYEHLQNSPDEQTFRAAKRDLRCSDVLDLTWMVAGPAELRSVQELLERLTSRVLPGVHVRFSTYDEPRYRSALQLQVGDESVPAAHGGVLAEWPGRPNGVDAAHLRIFLEPWATRQSGQVIKYHALPEEPRVASD